MRLKRLWVAGCMAAASTLLSSSFANAQADNDFYANKRLTLIVGAGEGASYDLVGRLIARYLPMHMVGAPTIITQNMPGASQTKATDYSFNIAPRDGTSLLLVQPSVILNKLLNPSARYEPANFTWVGRMQPMVGMGVVRKDAPVTSFDDARQHEVVMGANSPTGPASMVPTALNKLLGSRFKIVRGYESENKEALAMQRGEIDGIGNVMSSFLMSPDGWITSGLVKPIYANGLKRVASLPTIPTIVELVPEGEARQTMSLLAAISDVGLNLMAPPSIPPERVAILRKAFMDMTGDAGFQADFGKLGFAVDPMPGDALADFVASHFEPSPASLTRFRATVLPDMK